MKAFQGESPPGVEGSGQLVYLWTPVVMQGLLLPIVLGHISFTMDSSNMSENLE